MPEHVHLLLTPAHDITLERVMQLIKGGYSHRFGAEFGRKKEVWQSEYKYCSAFPGFRLDGWASAAEAA